MSSRCLAFVLIGSWLASAAASETFSFAPRDGLLVLRNGFVLKGRITPLGDSYLVSFGEGGEARLPRAEVEFECGDLDEAYLIKRDRLESDDAKSHLQLADWCLRHGLLARAADQLLTVRIQGSTPPTLVALERRLESLAQLANLPPAPAELSPSPKTVSVAAKHDAQEPDVPGHLLQQFTVSVQPILLNRCAAHACHGSGGSNAYRLVRPSLGQSPTSRLTRRNLLASLAYIDRQNPNASRLLTMAQQPHGGASSTGQFERTSNQLNAVASWVRRAGMDFSGEMLREESIAARPSSSAANLPTAASENVRDQQVKPAGFSDSTSPPPPGDPADFNRRHHGR
jgi:hypothetical protein